MEMENGNWKAWTMRLHAFMRDDGRIMHDYNPRMYEYWILVLERQRKNAPPELDLLILQCLFDYSQISPT